MRHCAGTRAMSDDSAPPPPPPPWATLAARRRVLEVLRRADSVPQSAVEQLHVDPTLYGAVFDAQRADERAGARATDAHWARAPVAFRFAAARGGGTLQWPPPRVERVRGRAFEVQEDGYLCGLHALNNVARALVLDPPDLLRAVGTLRPDGDFERTRDYTLYAQRAELFLAALRRGVVLAPLSLAALEDLDSLRGAASAFPRRKCVERLLRDTGGALVLAPGDRGAGGHWVPLVPSPGADGRWLIYSFNEVIVDEPTVGDALRRFLERRGGVAGASARATLSALQLAGAEYVALVPLHVLGADADDDRADDGAVARTLARLWGRSLLANARLVDGRDIQFVSPLTSPLALHHVCNTLVVGHALSGSLFRRLATQFALDVELNGAANQLAAQLATGDQAAVRLALRQLRSLLREARGTGLMLDAERNGGVPAAAWLRYAALLLAVRGIERRLDAGDGMRCARLVAVVAFSDLRAAGDTAARYEALDPFWRALTRIGARRAALPAADDAEVRREFLDKSAFVDAQLYAIGGGERMSRYLLTACGALDAGLPDGAVIEYVRARAFAPVALPTALDWRRADSLRAAAAAELARRLAAMERELRGPGATVGALVREYVRQADALVAGGERERLARATGETVRVARMRVRRVAQKLGILRATPHADTPSPEQLLGLFAADIKAAQTQPQMLAALRSLAAFDRHLRAFHLAALAVTDALGFPLLYGEYFDALEEGTGDQLLATIAQTADAADDRVAQQIERLFVGDGAESVYGLVLDQPPARALPPLGPLHALPDAELVPLSALQHADADAGDDDDDDDDDDFVVVVGRRARRRNK